MFLSTSGKRPLTSYTSSVTAARRKERARTLPTVMLAIVLVMASFLRSAYWLLRSARISWFSPSPSE